jgi:hypothetical protein
MTQADFVEALAGELCLCGVAFHVLVLKEFVAAAWPRIEEDPDARRWAAEFIAGDNGTLTA